MLGSSCVVYCPGNLLFASLKADHLVVGTMKDLCAEMSECRKRKNYGEEAKPRGQERMNGDFAHRGPLHCHG